MTTARKLNRAIYEWYKSFGLEEAIVLFSAFSIHYETERFM